MTMLTGKNRSFIADLSWGDFQKLAAATRRAAYPRQLTDEQVCGFIERMGPRVAEQIVRAKLDMKQMRGENFDDGLPIE